MASPRLLILGLDALPWRVLTPLIEAGAVLGVLDLGSAEVETAEVVAARVADRMQA